MKKRKRRRRKKWCSRVLQNKKMAVSGTKKLNVRSMLMMLLNFVLAFVFVSAERGLRLEASRFNGTVGSETNYLLKAVNFLWQPDKSGYQHVWPVNGLSLFAFSYLSLFS